MECGYILTDGSTYLKENFNNGYNVVSDINLASVFFSYIEANAVLQKQKKRKSFYIKETGELIVDGANESLKAIEEANNLAELEDFYKEYDDPGVRTYDKDNKFVYSKPTYAEENIFDIGEFLKTAIVVFSELDTYVENLNYLETEKNLEILDIRHYLRHKDCRLDAVAAQKLFYFEQELERKRETIKKNRTIASLFTNKFERIKDKNYIGVIDNVQNSEYRYRRFSKEKIDDIIKKKKKSA